MVLLYKPLYGWQISSLNAILINTFASELVFAHLRMSVHFDVWHIFTCLIRFKGCVLCIHFTKLILTAWVFFFNPSNYLYPNFFFVVFVAQQKFADRPLIYDHLMWTERKKGIAANVGYIFYDFFYFFSFLWIIKVISWFSGAKVLSKKKKEIDTIHLIDPIDPPFVGLYIVQYCVTWKFASFVSLNFVVKIIITIFKIMYIVRTWICCEIQRQLIKYVQ